LNGTLLKKFKQGDMVHVVFVEGFGWFVSEEAAEKLKVDTKKKEKEVEGILGIQIVVSEYLPFEYTEPRLEKEVEEEE
jgi:hypothetical protein